MRHRYVVALTALLAIASAAYGQPAPSTQYVTREEYEKLKAQLDQVQREQAEQKKQPAVTQADVDKTVEDIEKDIKANRSLFSDLRPGSTNFIITGYTFAGFTSREHENSTFGAGFNPIFLWKLTDRLFIEGELEVELEGSDTVVALEYAQLSYSLNDYVTFGVGKFLSPNNYFMERLHPAWINKLPDKPLMFEGDMRLLASTQVGAQVRGGVPIGATKIGYAFYVANGPSLRTSGASAGSLKFKTFEDTNDNKAAGGRVGFLPIPQLEVGYGFEVANAGASGTAFDDVSAIAHTVDLNYLHDSDLLGGTLDLRTQWAWLSIDNPNVAPLTFDNDRSGGYLQVAYRPSKLDNKFFKNVELVCRYELLDLPEQAPGAFDEKRLTLGVNYWIGPSAVVKVAYQFDDRDGDEDHNALLLQAAVGF